MGRIVGVDAVVGGAAGTVNGHDVPPPQGEGSRQVTLGSRHSMEWATRPTAPFDPRSTVTGPHSRALGDSVLSAGGAMVLE